MKGMSRSARIWTLLVIDSAFFFLEIIMLNDVLSLIVALYALQLAQRKHTTEEYTYGWQRAEVLGALVNGVFLVALCFSIFMEALERFFKGADVGNPKLVVVVGTLGLLSNIVGLFLFHDHGHAHGHGGHSHSHGTKSHAHDEDAAEQGRHIAPTRTASSAASGGKDFKPYRDDEDDAASVTESVGSEGDDLVSVHPAQTRANVVRAAQRAGYGRMNHQRTRSEASESENESRHLSRARASSASAKTGALVHIDEEADGAVRRQRSEHEHEHDQTHAHPYEHDNGHSHEEGDGHEHDHSHDHESGSMNMRGVFLHVMGDALGNVGVIGTGLFIWLSTYSWRSYSDPVISLVITCIIFSSALPLVRSASYILLQGTPSHVPLEQLRAAIMRVEGVLDVHELHVWSLSESKLIGSVHVLVKTQNFVPQTSEEIRQILHRFGIHSSTIQPECVSHAMSDGHGHQQLLGQVDLTGNGCPVTCVAACASEG